MNILYIGSAGHLSLVPFRKLLASEHKLVAAGVYQPLTVDGRLIALESNSLSLAAQQQQIPLIDLSQATADIIKQCSGSAIDVIVMSCYGKRLAQKIIMLAGRECINMHPSLLPGFRGPEPVFWQMKTASATGVSWHRVIQQLDAGDIVARQQVILPDGASYDEITLLLAQAGAELLLQVLSAIAGNTLTAVRQQAGLASYYPYPVARDFEVDTTWTARHAYNFMRATRAFGEKYTCRVGDMNYRLDMAVAYDNASAIKVVEVQGNRLYIPCKDGVLIAAYTGKMP